MKLYIKLDEPYEWVRVEGARVDAFGEVLSVDEYPVGKEDEVIGVVSGEWVTAHKLDLPAKNRKQFNAAVPFALEDAITEEVEDMHFVTLNWHAGEQCIVLAVAKEKMRQWQQLTTDNQLPVEQILPDYALLPMYDAVDYMVVENQGRILIRQRDGYGASLDHDLLDFWMKDLPLNAILATNEKALAEQLISDYAEKSISLFQVGAKMAYWLEHPSIQRSDLLSEQYRPTISRTKQTSLLIPVLIILAALGIKVFADGFRYLTLYNEDQNLSSQMQEILLQKFPEITSIPHGKERVMFERAMSQVVGTQDQQGLPTLLADVAPVMRKNKVELTNISYRNDELVLTCELSDFAKVDQITNQLKAIDSVQARLESSSADGDKVSARYKVTRG